MLLPARASQADPKSNVDEPAIAENASIISPHLPVLCKFVESISMSCRFLLPGHGVLARAASRVRHFRAVHCGPPWDTRQALWFHQQQFVNKLVDIGRFSFYIGQEANEAAVRGAISALLWLYRARARTRGVWQKLEDDRASKRILRYITARLASRACRNGRRPPARVDACAAGGSAAMPRTTCRRTLPSGLFPVPHSAQRVENEACGAAAPHGDDVSSRVRQTRASEQHEGEHECAPSGPPARAGAAARLCSGA